MNAAINVSFAAIDGLLALNSSLPVTVRLTPHSVLYLTLLSPHACSPGAF